MQKHISNKILQGDLIDLKALIELLLNSKKFIVFISLLFTVILSAYSYSQNKPSYYSSAKITIGNYEYYYPSNSYQIGVQGGYRIDQKFNVFLFYKGIIENEYEKLIIKTNVDVEASYSTILTISTSNFSSERESQLYLQQAIEYILNITNKHIENSFESASVFKNEKIEFLEKEIKRLSSLDKTLMSSYAIEPIITFFSIEKQSLESNISFELGNIIREIQSYQLKVTPIYIFSFIGLFFGLVFSTSVVILKSIWTAEKLLKRN